MAKLANKVRKWLDNPLFVILLVIAVIAFWTANSSYSFLGAAVGPDVKIISVTPDLTNKVITPGQTIEVKVTTKNLGLVNANYKVEHRLVADKNFPNYLSVVSPAGNAVAGEDDSVVTKQVTDQEPGEIVEIVMRAPVPTEESTIAESINNWDDTYVQIVGLYDEPGVGYFNNEYIVNTNVKVNSQYLEQTLDQSCEKNSDCSGWLLGASSCEVGKCIEKDLNWTSIFQTDDDAPAFSFSDYYDENKLLVWAIGIVLVALILGFAIPNKGR